MKFNFTNEYGDELSPDSFESYEAFEYDAQACELDIFAEERKEALSF
jgi:hypothetical protein